MPGGAQRIDGANVDSQNGPIAEINSNGSDNVHQLEKEPNKMHDQYKTVDDNNDNKLELVWDDASGAELNPSAAKPRAEEIEYVNGMGLHTKVPINECYTGTGRILIIARWVGIHKEYHIYKNYWSSLAAR